MRKRIVLANGCFDILHAGHVMHLEAAKEMGDILIVSVTEDAFVNKGPNRPIFKQEDRLRVVQALRCVDHAVLTHDVYETLWYVQPAIFVKGKDYVGKIDKLHEDFCKNHGIEIKFTDTPKYSSTDTISALTRRS